MEDEIKAPQDVFEELREYVGIRVRADNYLITHPAVRILLERLGCDVKIDNIGASAQGAVDHGLQS